MNVPASCPHCANPITEVIVIVDLADITQRLDRIEATLTTEGAHVASIDDELNTLETDVQALSDDEARELADLQALKDQGQTLSPEQQARFDALDAKVKADTAAIDQADPAPAPAAPAEPAPTGDSGGTETPAA